MIQNVFCRHTLLGYVNSQTWFGYRFLDPTLYPLTTAAGRLGLEIMLRVKLLPTQQTIRPGGRKHEALNASTVLQTCITLLFITKRAGFEK